MCNTNDNANFNADNDDVYNNENNSDPDANISAFPFDGGDKK